MTEAQVVEWSTAGEFAKENAHLKGKSEKFDAFLKHCRLNPKLRFKATIHNVKSETAT